MSPGLWVQMLGRGTRPAPGKQNCLVMDFAGNTRRLGPINDPVIPRPKGKGSPGAAPVKICPNRQCGVYNHASATQCFLCGTEFPAHIKYNDYADTAELIMSELPQIESFEVDRVVITPHFSKRSGKNSIQVSYYCKGASMRTFYEYISVESPSRFFKHKSREWFRQRYHYQNGVEAFNPEWEDGVPLSNSLVLQLQSELRHPTRINVWLNKQMPEIMSYEF